MVPIDYLRLSELSSSCISQDCSFSQATRMILNLREVSLTNVTPTLGSLFNTLPRPIELVHSRLHEDDS